MNSQAMLGTSILTGLALPLKGLHGKPARIFDTLALPLPARCGRAVMTAPGFLEPPLDMLTSTNLGGAELKRVYKASVDGWSALDFHRQVDGLGSTVVIGETDGGVRVGGYNPVGWESRDDYRATPRAFLFCALPSDETGEAEPRWTWQKCAVLGPGDVAIFD